MRVLFLKILESQSRLKCWSCTLGEFDFSTEISRCWNMQKVCKSDKLPKTNMAPENKASQKESSLQPSILRCYISFRAGISSSVPQFEPLSDVVFLVGSQTNGMRLLLSEDMPCRWERTVIFW